VTVRYGQNRLFLQRRGVAIVVASLLIILTTFLLLEAYPQPGDYFEFADSRRLFGVANFFNVISNAAFLIPGVAGLWVLRSNEMQGIMPGTRHIYVTLFAGVTLTAFGSSWFHLSPDNASLVWDRLPMTIVFMSLTAAVIAEHVSLATGRKLLLPLILIGIASVAYWSWTETRGMGDLRPYGLVQFLPMLLIPVIIFFYASFFNRYGHLLQMYLLYAIAKVAEHFDAKIYEAGQLLSGHSLKHIVAACAIFALFHGITIRRPIRNEQKV
jgi:hypothetical protein